MTRSPKYCMSEMNLAQAAELLWTAGCGALPVVDERQKVIGILTDRDICIRLGTTNDRASQVSVGEAMSRHVALCRPEDEIHSALRVMRSRKVHRIPVVTVEGKLKGMLSISEILLHARHDDGTRPELSHEDVTSTLCGIYVHCPPTCKCA